LSQKMYNELFKNSLITAYENIFLCLLNFLNKTVD